MTWEQLCALARELPDVTEGIWWRTPALLVNGKSFCRLKEDGRDVVFLTHGVDEQEFLCGAQPDVYYITDHYRGWPAVLARLAKLRVGEARTRLESAWRLKAPKKLLKARDGGDAAAPVPAKKPPKRPSRRGSSRAAAPTRR